MFAAPETAALIWPEVDPALLRACLTLRLLCAGLSRIKIQAGRGPVFGLRLIQVSCRKGWCLSSCSRRDHTATRRTRSRDGGRSAPVDGGPWRKGLGLCCGLLSRTDCCGEGQPGDLDRISFSLDQQTNRRIGEEAAAGGIAEGQGELRIRAIARGEGTGHWRCCEKRAHQPETQGRASWERMSGGHHGP